MIACAETRSEGARFSHVSFEVTRPLYGDDSISSCAALLAVAPDEVLFLLPDTISDSGSFLRWKAPQMIQAQRRFQFRRPEVEEASADIRRRNIRTIDCTPVLP